VRGYEPLVSDTLPKMPYIRGVVPSDDEPVVPVGTNPVGPTLALLALSQSAGIEIRCECPKPLDILS
jgi:hypothetical protein